MAYTTINKPSDYFNTVTYTGNGGTQSVTGVGFQPDWCWIKSRSNPGVYGHETYDLIRGVRNNLSTNSADAEFTIPTTGFESFDSDGFTVQLSDNYARGLNENNQLQVAWNWLASNTTASNTDGSITSTVSANTTSGFSIVSYTGTGANASVGHGLGSAPKMIIVKGRDTAVNWYVYHQAIGNQTYLNLNNTNTTGTPSSAYWNNTSPTSSVFYLGTGGDVNGSGQSKIAYCFAEKKGFSKFGSYQGTTSADGTFLYLGFKPAFLLVKGTTTAESWIMFDNQRGNQGVRSNPQDLRLLANATNAEADIDIDFLSNGVKFRTAENAVDHANTYMYMAFAEEPLVTSGKVPATAR